jgi:hypothetical protein
LSNDEREALHRHWLALLTCPRNQFATVRAAMDRLLDRINDRRPDSWNSAYRREVLCEDVSA